MLLLPLLCREFLFKMVFVQINCVNMKVVYFVEKYIITGNVCGKNYTILQCFGKTYCNMTLGKFRNNADFLIFATVKFAGLVHISVVRSQLILWVSCLEYRA